jgi:hypothetical protein
MVMDVAVVHRGTDCFVTPRAKANAVTRNDGWGEHSVAITMRSDMIA